MALLNFCKEKVLGRGSFGTVYLIRVETDHKELGNGCFAMREIDYVADEENVDKFVLKEISIQGEKQLHEARQEGRLLSQLNHPNIIRYFDSFESSVTGNLCLVMEYCPGGDVAAVIRQRRGTPFPEQQIVLWFQQLASALNYLHQRKILHRDVKTGNIFVSADSSILKLGDFGVAKVLEKAGQMARTCVGTPGYLSPEICVRKQYNSKSDIWSLGCVLYQLMTLHPPFTGRNMNQLLTAIVRGHFAPMPSRYSYELRQTVATMLRRNPEDRPSACTLLKKRLFSTNSGAPTIANITKRKINPGITVSRKGLGPLAVYAVPLLKPTKTAIKNRNQTIKKDKTIKKDHHQRRKWKPPTQSLIGALSSLCLKEASTYIVRESPDWSLIQLGSHYDSEESPLSDGFKSLSEESYTVERDSESPFHRMERWLVSLEAVHGVKRLKDGQFPLSFLKSYSNPKTYFSFRFSSPCKTRGC